MTKKSLLFICQVFLAALVYAQDGSSGPAVSGTKAIGASSLRDPEIYPNPCRQSFSISPVSDLQCIKIYDLQGREVLTREGSDNTGVDVSLLPSGSFVVQLITATAVLTKKLVVD